MSHGWNRRVLAAIAVGAFMACNITNSGKSSVLEAPSVEQPASKPNPKPLATPTTQPPPTAPSHDYSSLNGKLSDPLVQQIRAAREEFNAAKTPKDVHAAWTRARALGEALDEVLQPQYEATDMVGLELGWLLPHLPGMKETYVAEGTTIVFELDAATWQGKAAETEGKADDSFFALTNFVYQSASPSGYPVWHVRTWDYGGCSEIGRGKLIESLLKVDAAKAAGPVFATEIDEIRGSALSEVLVGEGESMFPRCDPSNLKPTPSDAIQAEARRILSEITLSEEEKAQLSERIPRLNGQEHTGG